MRTPFLGPAYVSRSLNLADQSLINLYTDIVETKTGKDVAALYMTPGLDLKLTVGQGPIRGMRNVSHRNLMVVVSGDQVYIVDTSLRSSLMGTVSSSSGPVTMIDNGTQVAIFDASQGYTITSVFSPIAFPVAGSPVVCAYQDGFGVVNVLNTQQWYQSNINDLTTWNALNFSSADAQPDDVVAIVSIHREMWLIKQFDTEVWINAGLSGFVFQRLQGIFLEVGCPAPYSPAVTGEGICWLAQNREGQISVIMTEGYKAARISTYALESTFASYPGVADAIGYSYAQEGHLFYVLQFPAGNATWVYDVTASRLANVPMWHQRASLSRGVFNRHASNCFAYFNGLPLVGDYQSGNIYAFNLDQPLDNGVQRKWLRSWRALPKPSEDVQQFNFLRIDMENGLQVPQGTDPQLMLRWSDDGGHVWTPYMQGSCNPIGSTARRVMFRRLGSTRRSSGLDRILELSSTDRFKVSLIGAEIG